MTQALRNSYIYITDPKEVVQLKDMLVLFVLAIRHFSGDSTSHLTGLIEELREHYAEVLMTQLARGIQKQLDEDNFKPLEITSIAHCRDSVGDFPMAEPKAFPFVLQFSKSVPGLYSLFLNYVELYANFCAGLPENKYRKTQMDDVIRRAVLISIERTLVGCIMSFCRAEEALDVKQLAQIHENCRMLEYAFSNRLDELVNSRVMTNRKDRKERGSAAKTKPIQAGRYMIRDQCRPLFEELRSQIRSHTLKVVTGKIDELLIQVNSYNWSNAAESPTEEASPYMVQLSGYFREVIERSKQLPQEWIHAVFLHMTENLHRLLLKEVIEVAPCLTSGVLQQIETDVKIYERFVSHLNAEVGCTAEDVKTSFAKLLQLLAVSLSWDWDTFAHEYHQAPKNKNYPLISASEALIILEKMKEAERGKDGTIFSGLKKAVRERFKLLDQVLKQLKQLKQEEDAARRDG